MATRKSRRATADIGTGTYTVMAQIAADMLGLPLGNVSVKLGDSTLPKARWRAARGRAPRSARPSQDRRGRSARDLLRLAQEDARIRRSPAPASTTWRSPRARSSASGREPCGLDRRARCGGGVERIERGGSRGAEATGHARNTHSAIFAEVEVDEEFGTVRVTRVVNAIAAGRIINPKTARSQVMGGIVWGIGLALHEETSSTTASAAS